MSMGRTYSKKLQCEWISCNAISDEKLELILPPLNVCDMTGAIAFAKSVLPSVRDILVGCLVDGNIFESDVLYSSDDGKKWKAFSYRKFRSAP